MVVLAGGELEDAVSSTSFMRTRRLRMRGLRLSFYLAPGPRAFAFNMEPSPNVEGHSLRCHAARLGSTCAG